MLNQDFMFQESSEIGRLVEKSVTAESAGKIEVQNSSDEEKIFKHFSKNTHSMKYSHF